MLRSLAHRGPDGLCVAMVEPGVALGHARLAIVDAAGGRQPLTNEDATVWLVLNGEIYDDDQHRAALSRRGHRFASANDAEVVVHLYEEHGPRFLELLEGEFSLVLWDARRRELVLARDSFGIKPLYWTELGEGTDREVLVASEAKALLSLPRVRSGLSGDYLSSAAFGVFSGADCAFEGVRCLPPGHLARVTAAGTRVERWWTPHPQPSADPQDLDAALRAAVKRRLRVDPHIEAGVLLSGGLDSAIIARLATDAGARPTTFTLRFDEEGFDEGPTAACLARSLDLPHVEVHCSLEDLAVGLPKTIFHTELIPANAHVVARRLLLREVRLRGTSVVLTGEGADELFGGYPLFRLERAWALGQAVSEMGLGRGLLWDDEAPDPGPMGYRSYFYARARRLDASVDHLVERVGPLPSERVAAADQGEGFARTRRQSLSQLASYLLPCLGDRVEMAHGVEGRQPFLDRGVANLALALDGAACLDAHGKEPLRRLYSHVLPRSSQGPKHPFMAPPWHRVLRTAAGRDLLEQARRDLPDLAPLRPDAFRLLLTSWDRLPERHQARLDPALGLLVGASLLRGELLRSRSDTPPTEIEWLGGQCAG